MPLTANREDPPVRSPHSLHLTRRETQLTDGLLAGKANKIIAYELNISENTVKVYLSRLFQKFGVRSRFELVTKVRANQELRSRFYDAGLAVTSGLSEGQKFIAIARTIELSADELRDVLGALISRCTRV